MSTAVIVSSGRDDPNKVIETTQSHPGQVDANSHPGVTDKGARPFHRYLVKPPYIKSFIAIAKFSWTNILLIIFVPLGWTFHFYLEGADIAVAVVNLIALAAVSHLLRFSFDQLALCFGVISGLIYEAELNLTEFIFVIMALKDCDIQTVQAVLMGVIINILPVIGIFLLVGGYTNHEQKLDIDKAQICTTLLMLGTTIQVLPGIVSSAASSSENFESLVSSIAHMIRVVSIFVLIFYCFFGLFRYHCHKHQDTKKRGANFGRDLTLKQLIESLFRPKKSNVPSEAQAGHQPKEPPGDVENGSQVENPDQFEQPLGMGRNEREPEINGIVAVLVLGVSTVLTVQTTNYLWDALGNLTDNRDLSPLFVGIILVPLVSNFGQITTYLQSIEECKKNNMEVILDGLIGSAIQIALFITPLLVLTGWGLGIPLFLINDPPSSAILVLSVLVLNYVIADGKSNWLEGAVLILLYIMFAIVLWHYHGVDITSVINSTLNVCYIDGSAAS